MAGTVVSSTAAVSAAEKPSTSRSVNAPRWVAGSDCSSAVTANRTSPERSAVCSTTEPPNQPVGAGISHGTSSAGTRGAPTSMPGSCRSRGSGLRPVSRSRSMQTLRAIRKHQVVRLDRAPSYCPRARQARSKTSCTASSASNGEPSIW